MKIELRNGYKEFRTIIKERYIAHIYASKIFTTIPSKTCDFSNKFFFACKYRKIWHFTQYRVNSLKINKLAYHLTKSAVLGSKNDLVTMQRGCVKIGAASFVIYCTT